MVGTLSFLPIIKFKLFNPQMKNFIGWWLLHCHFKKNFFDLAFLVIQSEIPFRNFQNILVYYQKIIFFDCLKIILISGFSTESEFRLEQSFEPGNIDDRAVTG